MEVQERERRKKAKDKVDKQWRAEDVVHQEVEDDVEWRPAVDHRRQHSPAAPTAPAVPAFERAAAPAGPAFDRAALEALAENARKAQVAQNFAETDAAIKREQEAKRAASGVLEHVEKMKAAAAVAARAAEQRLEQRAKMLGTEADPKKPQMPDPATKAQTFPTQISLKPMARDVQQDNMGERHREPLRRCALSRSLGRGRGDDLDHERKRRMATAFQASDRSRSRSYAVRGERDYERGADAGRPRKARTWEAAKPERVRVRPPSRSRSRSYGLSSNREHERRRGSGRCDYSASPDGTRGEPIRRARGYIRHDEDSGRRSPIILKPSPETSRSRAFRERDPPGDGKAGDIRARSSLDGSGQVAISDGDGGSARARRSAFDSGPPGTVAASVAEGSCAKPRRAGSGFDGGAPAAAPPTDRKLRQLGVRNGWAEFVDQHNGEHVYKNVLTGEMTTRKPAEYGSLISDTMNQRRLSWLANQRAAAQVADLTLKAAQGT